MDMVLLWMGLETPTSQDTPVQRISQQHPEHTKPAMQVTMMLL